MPDDLTADDLRQIVQDVRGVPPCRGSAAVLHQHSHGRRLGHGSSGSCRRVCATAAAQAVNITRAADLRWVEPMTAPSELADRVECAETYEQRHAAWVAETRRQLERLAESWGLRARAREGE